MEKTILSLKNIYRLLTVRDYPVYSLPVISEKNKKGLTLLNFWKENLLYEFRSGSYGRMVWRSQGGRNRFLSDMCNRSERIHFYEEYAAELAAQANPGTLLRQIEQIMLFLKSRAYSPEAFERRFSPFLEMLEEQDGYFSCEVKAFLICGGDRSEEEGNGPAAKGCGSTAAGYGPAAGEMRYLSEFPLFLTAWQVTFLTLFAMSGSGMDGGPVQRVMKNKELTARALWNMWVEKQQSGQKYKIHFMTGKNSELCREPLPLHQFFGRQVELFDLREQVQAGGHVLLSGIGGIGKTELLCQILQLCEQEGLTEEAAVIQYEGSLAESMVRAFALPSAGSLEENFRSCLAMLRRQRGKRVLILIDNVNCSAEEDPDLKELQKLPGTVLVSSRQPELEGFDTYEMKQIEKEAAMLIFRDNYVYPLTGEDRQGMEVLLENLTLRHPLMLRLLGCGASSRQWSVAQLLEQLETGGVNFTWKENTGETDLKKICRQLYVQGELDAGQQQFLRLLSLMPYERYEMAFLERYLGGIFTGKENIRCGLEDRTGGAESPGQTESLSRTENLSSSLEGEDDLAKELEGLYHRGWLERSRDGWSMHPFIAECIRPRQVTEKELEILVANAAASGILDEADITAKRSGNERLKLSEVVMKSAARVSGVISLRLLRLVLAAAWHGMDQGSISRKECRRVWDMLMRCPEAAENERIGYYLIVGNHYMTGEELKVALEEQRRQEKRRTVSQRTYATLCLILGCPTAAGGADGWKGSEELLMQGLNCVVDEEQRLEACQDLQVYHIMAGRYEEAIRWTEEIVKLTERRELLETGNGLVSLLTAGSFYVALHRYDEAKAILERAAKALDVLPVFLVRKNYLMLAGQFAMHTGESGAGAVYLKEALEMTLLYYGEKDANYYQLAGELAIAMQREGRFEEALNYDLECVEFWKAAKYEHLEFIVRHNTGVLYLAWEKPGEALDWLDQAAGMMDAFSEGEQGEVFYNLARTYRMLDNRGQELEYLERAYPILLRHYGPEHEKTVMTAKRLSADN